MSNRAASATRARRQASRGSHSLAIAKDSRPDAGETASAIPRLVRPKHSPDVASMDERNYDQRSPKACRTPSGDERGRLISSDLLLHRVSAGDSAAVQECIARFSGLVWSLARRTGLPEAEMEDAVHEIFTELWQHGHKYDPSIASEAAFVAVIARRRLIDRRRKLGRQPLKQELPEFLSTGDSPTGRAKEISEDAAVAAMALATLSADQQRVLRLSVYEGLSHELISRATGLPLGTVKTHARRGLIRLREILADPAKIASIAQTGGSD
ncbi:MAG: sigma-70 family RNA polymerase sigma factor [Phycisphaeraceae bacterium]|nr:sigma-70 family RNA polymerase sigma factor [Phycisphaeraceae bacterium]